MRRHPLRVLVIVATAAAATVTGVTVSAMAAPGTTPASNYRGPARPAITRQTVVSHQTNYRGPASNPAQITALPARHSNVPAQKGSK